MLLTTIIPFVKAKKKGESQDYVDLSLSTMAKKEKLDWTLLFRSLLLALTMAAFMYAQCWLAEKCFMLDFRFIWPFFKTFSLTRLGQFGVYILVFLVFFLLNNSKIFAQNQPVGASLPGFGNFMKCWVKNALCMIGDVLLLIVLEYTPFFMGFGPGADLLILRAFSDVQIVISIILNHCFCY